MEFAGKIDTMFPPDPRMPLPHDGGCDDCDRDDHVETCAKYHD